MNHKEIIEKLFANKKGILALDESIKSIGKRFEAFNIENTHENRSAYRNIMLNMNDFDQYVSGIIFHEETLNDIVNNTVNDTINNIANIHPSNIIKGIKVDQGLLNIPKFEDEMMTIGLDTLHARLLDFKKKGALFTKWRVVIDVHNSTEEIIHLNLRNLAIYASMVLEAGLVPILEPEVLHDGTHTMIECKEKMNYVLTHLLGELALYKVDIENIIFKISMVLPGTKSLDKQDENSIAEANIDLLASSIPQNIGGVIFLSGGQGVIEATKNLSNIINSSKEILRFNMTYSYSRAIQDPVLKAFADKKDKNFIQEVFRNRLNMLKLALDGKYEENMENKEYLNESLSNNSTKSQDL